MSWKTDLSSHFKGRTDLSPEELSVEFKVDSPDEKGNLARCLELLHEEYGISPGFLRSSDRFEVFITRTPTRNPIRAFFDQAALEFRVSELNLELNKRADQIGVPVPRSPVTIGDYVDAWLGRLE